MNPIPNRRFWIVLALMLGTEFLLLDRFVAMDAPWGVDEGQRIAESYFWRLASRGDFSHRDWFRASTIRSHPPVNKYLFGIAIAIHGLDPPRSLDLAEAYERGAPSHSVPQEFERDYLPMRRAARRAAMLCIVLSGLVVFAILWRWFGVFAGLASQVLFFRHVLVTMLLFDARSDAVQTLTATACAIPLWRLWRSRCAGPSRWIDATVLGTFAALSFQTRVSGLLPLAAGIVVLGVLAIRSRSVTPLAPAIVATIVLAIVGTMINPYYWADAPLEAGVPEALAKDRWIGERIVERYAQQYRDLRALLDEQEERWRMRHVDDRVEFVASILFSGIAGMLTAAGIILAIAFGFVRGSERREAILFALVWAAALCGIFTVWIPLRWEPYVLTILPSAILLAAAGWGELWKRASAFFERARRSEARS